MPRTRRMRDMARRRMDMARRRRDYARGSRDYRNPYGSEGGYVVSRRTGRDMLMMDVASISMSVNIHTSW